MERRTQVYSTFHTLPLFYLRELSLRAYARKNYPTEEIYPKTIEIA